MSEIKHTPTPWRYEVMGASHSEYAATILGRGTAESGWPVVADIPPRTENGTHEANAAFIVTAVNAYDKQRALIETLNAALLAMTSWLMVVSDHLELDPEETRVNVRVIGPDGSRDFASRSLLEITEQATIALEAAKEQSA